MEKIKINNLSVVECKLIKQLNKEDHVVCFKKPCLLSVWGMGGRGEGTGCSISWKTVFPGVV